MKTVRPEDVVATVVRLSGKTQVAVAEDMGRSTNYVGNLVRSKTSPRIDTCAEIADVCGFDLQFVDRETGEGLRVLPTDEG